MEMVISVTAFQVWCVSNFHIVDLSFIIDTVSTIFLKHNIVPTFKQIASWSLDISRYEFPTSSIIFAFQANVIKSFKCNLCIQVLAWEDRFVFVHWAVFDFILSATRNFVYHKVNLRN